MNIETFSNSLKKSKVRWWRWRWNTRRWRWGCSSRNFLEITRRRWWKG